MGKLIIVVATLILLLVLGARNSKNNKKLIRAIKQEIREINSTYIGLFREKSMLARLIQILLIIGAEIFIAISIITSIIRHINTEQINIIDGAVKLIIIVVTLIFVHFLMGYILASTIKIHKFIYGVENRNLKVDLLLSYFIIGTFFAVLLLDPLEFENVRIIGLIGTSICYFLNMKILICIIKNPHSLKSKKQSETAFMRLIVAALFIVILVILNLYLAVCFINGTTGEAFTNMPDNFDLFYYTIITFTTVGYGDIVPVTIAAKIISVVISVTSVICITIFLSTILSYRDKVESNEEGNI